MESSEAKKTPHLCDRFGLRSNLNNFNLGFINFNSQWSNNIAKKRYSVGAKGALPNVTKQTCITYDRGKGVPSFGEMMDIALVEVDFDDPTTNVRGRRALAIAKPTPRGY